MEPDYCQSLARQRALVLQDQVQILVVAPAHQQLVHAAPGRVHAILRAVHLVGRVRVSLEHLGEDASLVEAAADRKRVAHDVPLAGGAVVQHEHDLSQVVDESSQLHPSRLAIAADRLGALQQVVDLAELRVGVAVVDQCVELFYGLPDGHLEPWTRGRIETLACRQVVSHCLLGMVLGVEVLDPLARIGVSSKRCLVFLGVEARFGVKRCPVHEGRGPQDVDRVDSIGYGLEGRSVSVDGRLTHCNRGHRAASDVVQIWQISRPNAGRGAGGQSQLVGRRTDRLVSTHLRYRCRGGLGREASRGNELGSRAQLIAGIAPSLLAPRLRAPLHSAVQTRQVARVLRRGLIWWGSTAQEQRRHLMERGEEGEVSQTAGPANLADALGPVPSAMAKYANIKIGGEACSRLFHRFAWPCIQ
ncbi:89b13250-4d62-48bf-a38d-91ee954c6ffb [Thermothielavioides terrestris]|uniref:89b13250-4d62-48bf-a38d-91ee954c6ffb n=1 Tax=Thermothielavioides terrestris TaxID=2587410 RepID=A0A3S4C9Q2_9PEZI|nr:89b13250-4d62-48bf-a38d-91ee954c6ffb [Thermothielavioides terrestris]